MSFFSRAHERILRKFLLHRVDFVLIGGHAVVFYGVRRTTSDIDILVRDLLKNKESIKRGTEKNLVDQQDILALRRILKSK
jgi:hypothetical protein